MRTQLSAILLTALVGTTPSLAGCDNSVVRPDASAGLDGGAPPAVPQITEGPPAVLPWPLATVRGRAPGAARVLVRGIDNPTFVEVLPDDTFCVDVGLPTVGAFDIELVGQSEAGFSMPATVGTRFDPMAPVGEVIPTCAGADPRGCGSEEICDNLIDDDCDTAVDAADPDCASCPDDLLEPNDSEAEAPRIPPGVYEGLRHCPDEDDWYQVFLRDGETLELTLRFVDAEGNVNVRFFDPAGEQVALAISGTDDELLTYTALATGLHAFRVYQFGAAAPQGYAMEVAVSGP